MLNELFLEIILCLALVSLENEAYNIIQLLFPVPDWLHGPLNSKIFTFHKK